MSAIEVHAFYKFVPLPGFAEMRVPLRDTCQRLGLRGTILLAPEGINGTIAGTTPAMTEALGVLRSFPGLADLETRKSASAALPFKRMKVRLKREIVTMGVADADPRRAVGHYVEPEDWNSLISDPDVLVIDTRNGFEVQAGTFAGAIDPETRNFGEFPAFVASRLAGDKTRRIAMFCTGGIRCEKATSHMIAQGFENVFHLKGGILAYLATIPPEESQWRGGCFVFDERVALGHGLEQVSIGDAVVPRDAEGEGG